MGTQQSKAEIVDQVRKNFDEAVAVVIVNFEGLDVPSVTDLRAQFREAGVEYKVVKNNLIKKALEGTELLDNEELTSQLKGMTAVAWSYEGPLLGRQDHQEVPQGGRGLRREPAGQVRRPRRADPQRRARRERARHDGGQGRAPRSAPGPAHGAGQNLVRQLLAPGQNLAFALDARQRQLEEQA